VEQAVSRVRLVGTPRDDLYDLPRTPTATPVRTDPDCVYCGLSMVFVDAKTPELGGDWHHDLPDGPQMPCPTSLRLGDGSALISFAADEADE
jgi:hypothetical protein